MSKSQVNQILITTVSIVVSGLILDYFRNNKPLFPPVTENNKTWYN